MINLWPNKVSKIVFVVVVKFNPVPQRKEKEEFVDGHLHKGKKEEKLRKPKNVHWQWRWEKKKEKCIGCTSAVES